MHLCFLCSMCVFSRTKQSICQSICIWQNHRNFNAISTCKLEGEHSSIMALPVHRIKGREFQIIKKRSWRLKKVANDLERVILHKRSSRRNPSDVNYLRCLFTFFQLSSTLSLWIPWRRTRSPRKSATKKVQLPNTLWKRAHEPTRVGLQQIPLHTNMIFL